MAAYASKSRSVLHVVAREEHGGRVSVCGRLVFGLVATPQTVTEPGGCKQCAAKLAAALDTSEVKTPTRCKAHRRIHGACPCYSMEAHLLFKGGPFADLFAPLDGSPVAEQLKAEQATKEKS